MRTESPHEHEHGASSSSPEEVSGELIRERIQDEKQPVHEKWWMIALFAAIVPFGLTFASSMSPLAEFIRGDSAWDPPISDEDMMLLDGAVIAPSVVIPVVVGIAMDAAWSVNLTLLMCLIGSVVGQFFVAMGIAWHSFGLMLTGRIVNGFCFGSIFVVADVIAAQFNRKRRAVTLGIIGAVQALALNLNLHWARTFTETQLGGDFEKSNDIMLIAMLVCLGVGFLWSPLVNSYEMVDSVKRRYWKWHVPLPVWTLGAAQLISIMLCGEKFFGISTSVRSTQVLTLIVLSPLLGYYLDRTDKSQAGSLSVTRYLLVAACLVLAAQVLSGLLGVVAGDTISAIGLGVMPMLIRAAVPQVASRDNIATSFGLVEGASFLGAMFVTTATPGFLGQLAYIVIDILIFGYVMFKVSEKWQHVRPEDVTAAAQRRLGELSEPLHGRGA